MMIAINAVYLAALLCGLIAIWKDSRARGRVITFNTAFILLAGAFLSAALFASGITDRWATDDMERGLLYVSIDLSMAIPILFTQRRMTDTLIVVLFIGAWPFYFFGDHMMEPVTSLIASLQLFLTFPLPQWGVRCVSWFERTIGRDPSFKMAAAQWAR